MVEDPARVAVPPRTAMELTRECTVATAGHMWDPSNVEAARAVLATGCGGMLIDALAWRRSRRLSGHTTTVSGTVSGWVVLTLPTMLGDEELQVVASGLLAAVGMPFN